MVHHPRLGIQNQNLIPKKEPDFGVTSVNYDFQELLAKSEVPS